MDCNKTNVKKTKSASITMPCLNPKVVKTIFIFYPILLENYMHMPSLSSPRLRLEVSRTKEMSLNFCMITSFNPIHYEPLWCKRMWPAPLNRFIKTSSVEFKKITFAVKSSLSSSLLYNSLVKILFSLDHASATLSTSGISSSQLYKDH